MKSNININLALAALFILVIFVALPAHASLVTCGNNLSGENQTPCGVGDLIGTGKLLINFLLSWAWLISVLFIVISGMRMVLAAGNEESLSAAKTSLTQAIVGFIIILLSFVIINLALWFLTGSGPLDANVLLDSIHLVP